MANQFLSNQSTQSQSRPQAQTHCKRENRVPEGMDCHIQDCLQEVYTYTCACNVVPH